MNAFVLNAVAVAAGQALSGMPAAALLQIHREGVKPGSEAAYAAVEHDTARICAQQRCPHPYLAVESLTGPKEVWFFNGYADETEQRNVDTAYKANATLIQRMKRNSARKASLTIDPRGVVARYLGSRNRQWVPGQGRFLVITVTREQRELDGSTFETADGLRFVIVATHSRADADAAAATAGPGARVFAVRPGWSFPSSAWVSADEQFWRSGSGRK